MFGINTNLPQEEVQVILPEKEVSDVPGDGPYISTNEIFIVMWKDQVQRSMIENTVFY